MELTNLHVQFDHYNYVMYMEEIFGEVFEKAKAVLSPTEQKEIIDRWIIANHMEHLTRQFIIHNIEKFSWQEANKRGWLCIDDYKLFKNELRAAGVTHDYFGQLVEY